MRNVFAAVAGVETGAAVGTESELDKDVGAGTQSRLSLFTLACSCMSFN